MNYNVVNNISFKGAYLVNYSKAKNGTREKLESTIGNHHYQIYDDFNGKTNNVLYVLRNGKDYDFGKEIIDNNWGIRFKYMPDVDTKLRFDTQEDAVDFFKENEVKTITNKNDLLDYITQNRISRQKMLAVVKPSKKELLKNILRNMGVFLDDIEYKKDSKGVTKIFDSQNNLRVKISPYNPYDVAFVVAKETNTPNSEINCYAIDKEGSILHKFSTPKDLATFKKKFNESIVYLCHPEKFK